MMRILVADDDSQVRSALCLLLEQEAGMDVVAEVSDVPGLIEAASRAQPALLLVDYELSGMRAPGELFNRLRRICPGLKVVALSGKMEARRSAMAAGADGFISKGDSPERLLSLVRRVGLFACGANNSQPETKPAEPAVNPSRG